jgi:hypothetical protein
MPVHVCWCPYNSFATELNVSGASSFPVSFIGYSFYKFCKFKKFISPTLSAINNPEIFNSFP